MNGIHDLGGLDGFGPVPVEQDEPVWHHEWEKAAFTLLPTNLRAGIWGVDSFRAGIETMPPTAYLLTHYYEHWMHSAEHHGDRSGVLDMDELDRRTQHYLENPDEPLPERHDPELLAFVDAAVKGGACARRQSDKVARFQIGDRVTVVNEAPLGHHRRARYVRGCTGVVDLAHGPFIYPDTAGNGGDEAPEHVYTLKFTNAELWGAEAAEPNGVVYFDVWEPYIVPATSATSEGTAA